MTLSLTMNGAAQERFVLDVLLLVVDAGEHMRSHITQV